MPQIPKKPVLPTHSEKEKFNARQTLNSYGVNSYSRCFVNPNAVCPVCGQSVYFYSNTFGSRVFFDELGKPLTKHQCTDNNHSTSTTVKVRPVRRPLSEIDRILDAEEKINLRILPESKKDRKKSWKLALVIKIKFSDLAMSVLIEDLSTKHHQKHKFQVYCDKQILNVGDFVSWRGNTFSFLNSITLESIEVINGEVLLNLDEIEGGINHNEIPQKITEMLTTEKRHFSYGLASNFTVPGELLPVLQTFEKRRVIGGKLVAHYLNEIGYKTADGSPWTPRLATFLIFLTGVSQERPPVSMKTPQKNGRTPNKLTNDVDEWAKMLSCLGRVTRKGSKK